MKCRHCGASAKLPFVDLGSAPPSNAYLNESDLVEPEKWFPLKVVVCPECWLVQTEDYAHADEEFCRWMKGYLAEMLRIGGARAVQVKSLRTGTLDKPARWVAKWQ